MKILLTFVQIKSNQIYCVNSACTIYALEATACAGTSYKALLQVFNIPKATTVHKMQD